ncbi:cytochrome c oxidase assembly protein [uncultured Xylophilus sp.]|uniref:cytochrome c oxidase assembly protein n=1 Tax=uncultured Xylophilus sp. TaxID=296832 RepID=UPI0025DA082E|nr:cytochrome c oxidase assembly protein [uncultured Xylophilus sp.]
MNTGTADRLWSLCTSAAPPALPGDWIGAWSLAPASLVAVALLAAIGLCHRATDSAARRRQAWWWTGVALMVLALLSPLCRLGATLVAGHMAQLMLIATAAGAALAAGSVPRHIPWRPTPAAAAYSAVLWGWHLPPVYAATLTDPAIHAAAYVALAAVSWWFWCAVLQAPAARRGAAFSALGFTVVHTGLLGALLTFAPVAYYPLQTGGATAWGLSPLEDQQLAGLLMWIPGGIVYGGAAFALALRWLEPPADTAPA